LFDDGFVMLQLLMGEMTLKPMSDPVEQAAGSRVEVGILMPDRMS
jgi:hypothetical protein